MIKTYRTINSFKFSAAITVGGHVRFIDFLHGTNFPEIKNGIFSTDNKELQDAIEKNHLFGKEFQLEVFEQPKQEEKELDNLEVITSDDVKNTQQAKEWLINNKGLKLAQLPNKEVVIQKALENNIRFECFQ